MTRPEWFTTSVNVAAWLTTRRLAEQAAVAQSERPQSIPADPPPTIDTLFERLREQTPGQ